jgi:hypothetical protein
VRYLEPEAAELRETIVNSVIDRRTAFVAAPCRDKKAIGAGSE